MKVAAQNYRMISRVVPAVASVTLSAGIACAQVPAFLDEFSGPALDAEWTAISPGSHPGFTVPGKYVVDGVLSANSGLARSMGGQGDFCRVEPSREL